MSAISITVTQDTANQALFELMQSVTPARFAGKVGPALVNETKQHLGRLGKNKQGYKSTRFYENFSVSGLLTIAAYPSIFRQPW